MDLQNITFVVKDGELILRPSRDIMSLSGTYESKSFKDKTGQEIKEAERFIIERGFVEKFSKSKLT